MGGLGGQQMKLRCGSAVTDGVYIKPHQEMLLVTESFTFGDKSNAIDHGVDVTAHTSLTLLKITGDNAAPANKRIRMVLWTYQHLVIL